VNDTLRRLRDAVAGGGDREVVVDPDGTVREAAEQKQDSVNLKVKSGTPTKLADRTFG
jgi:hypothetical protein